MDKLKVRLFFILLLFTISTIFVSTGAPDGTNILITEVLYDTPGTDSIEEWVELYNPTDSSINLAGWSISDNIGSFSISGTIGANDYLVIAADTTGFNALYGFNPDISGMTLALGNTGDLVTLKDATSTEVDMVAWEGEVIGWTISATYTTIRRTTATDTDTVVDWENSGSTGDPGTGVYSGSSSSGSDIVINEFLPDPNTLYSEEWIELFNPTSQTIDLSDYVIDDLIAGGTAPYTIPGGTTIAAGGYLVFYQSVTNIAFNNAGDDVNFLDTDGTTVIDSYSYSSSLDDVSYGRETDGSATWVTFTTPTPGAANFASSGTADDIVINEFLPDPNTLYTEEWIELYNPTGQAVDLSDYILDDLIAGGTVPYTIPGGTTIAAGGYLVFYQSVTNVGLNNAGDDVNFLDTDGSTVIDSYSYPSSIDDVSYGRETDGSAIWTTFTTPTPGSANSGGAGPDTTPPVVSIISPLDGATVGGIVIIMISASDAGGIASQLIKVDGETVSTTTSYSWDTIVEAEGTHIIYCEATDPSNNTGSDTHTITVDNTSPPPPSDGLKVMVYNIKESGESATHPDWKEVVKEENADIIMFIETGYWEDNSNAKFNQYVSEFNTYFALFDELPYVGYCLQDISYSTSGAAIMSRYPVTNWVQIADVPLDDSSMYDVTHDFMDATVNVDGTYIHLVGSHLKAMPDLVNEQRREWEQEGIINYMDDLGAVPIMYLGDLNSFSLEDWDLNTIQTGLGYGPISMMVSPYINPETSDDYSQYMSTEHTWYDVHRTLNPTDLGISNIDYDSRIDFIFINQFLVDKMISSTTGDTAHALTGSDHLSVDVIFNMTATQGDTIPPAQVAGLAAVAAGTDQIDLSWTANGEGDLDHYTIYRDGIVLITTTAISYSNIGLTENTAYTYEVSAVDTSANEGIKSVSASATTDALPSDCISVSSIDMWYVTVRNKITVYIEITILDSSGSPVEGADVSIELTDNKGTQWTASGTTGTDGKVLFTFARLKAGRIYITVIVDVQHSTFVYDPLMNIETTEELYT
ncbi:MAG: lamin tail domain-containing protein [Candidatus Kariarchaeaceae archaeon]